jgi:hypothetical protein
VRRAPRGGVDQYLPILSAELRECQSYYVADSNRVARRNGPDLDEDDGAMRQLASLAVLGALSIQVSLPRKMKSRPPRLSGPLLPPTTRA